MVQFYLWRQDDKGANIIWITNKSTTPWAVLGVIPYTHVWLLGWSSTSLWQRHSFFTSCVFFFGSWFFYIFFDYFFPAGNFHLHHSVKPLASSHLSRPICPVISAQPGRGWRKGQTPILPPKTRNPVRHRSHQNRTAAPNPGTREAIFLKSAFPP